MPYTKPKSRDVWFNLPGCVVAYQPVGAPDKVSALQNVSNNFGRLGQYTAMPGIAPTFSPSRGWTFDGTTQYLDTQVIPLFLNNFTYYSMICQFSGVSAYGILCGEFTSGARFDISPYNQFADQHAYNNGGNGAARGVRLSSGNMAMAGSAPYLNGVPDGASLATGFTTNTLSIWIGNRNGSAQLLGCKISAFSIYSRTLSSPEIFQAAYQMKYCNMNPDWSAWSRKRNWYFAAVPGAVGIYGARATIALPGGVSIRATGGQT